MAVTLYSQHLILVIDLAESTGNNTTNSMPANVPDTPTSSTAPTPPEGECSNNGFLVSVYIVIANAYISSYNYMHSIYIRI